MFVKVLIADDHSVVRQGLRTFLELDPEIQIVGTATDGNEALSLTQALRPNVVLMDLMMPDMDGFDATKAIKKALPETVVLVLTSNADDNVVAKAIQAGANGFLLKTMEAQELCHSIKTASLGQLILSPQAARILAHQQTQATQSPPAERLTTRELDVLRLLSDGQTNKEIAHNLQLSEKTVKIHVSIILSKLGMQSRTQAALYASKIGLI